MLTEARVSQLKEQGRYVAVATTGDDDLGPLKLLPGTWKNTDAFNGRGWNMIALPFATGAQSPFNYRLLVNQYNEELKFTLVDKAVPNRGIPEVPGDPTTGDQLIVTLDFEQMIKQIAADDRIAAPGTPQSGLAGPANLAIHHEPGLWLHMTNKPVEGVDIARLSTIPHGDSVLALGHHAMLDGPPTIPPVNGLPFGVPQNVDTNPYLAPYKHYRDAPFKGVLDGTPFPGFNPSKPEELLTLGMPQGIKRTTVLQVDTTLDHAGIVNIPFIVRQANAATMKSTFWICELDEKDAKGNPKLVLMYLQVVVLDFFPRIDGLAGPIRWPHVSINAMEKVAEPDTEKAQMPGA
jgi:hypothetical protein